MLAPLFQQGRGERKKCQAIVDVTTAHEPSAKASATWVACVKRIYEINPLECPKCKGTMRIIAFIHDPHELGKIMAALKYPDFKAPEAMATGPPDDLETLPGDIEYL